MRILILFGFLFWGFIVKAQKPYVGSVKDTSERKLLVNASVSILRSKDSVFIQSVRTNQNGVFRFEKLPSDKFILFVSFPNYADYFIETDAQHWTKDFVIYMLTKQQVLKEIVVLQKLGAIRTKKDTIEFIADSFKLMLNSSVEDLMRRLPGFKIKPDGSIEAQGESVSRVLVDGEEFFGNDPTIATKNLKAEYVEKVQVYDRKSDKSTFTGVDDGVLEKTVNIQLKKNKNRGYIAKAGAGYGPENRSSAQLMGLLMKGKKRVGAVSSFKNTNIVGVSWEDINKYSSDWSIPLGEMRSIGVLNLPTTSSNSQYGVAYPVSSLSTGQYSNMWNRDSTRLNVEFLNRIYNSEGDGLTRTQYLFSDSTLTRIDSGSSYSRFSNQRVRFKLTHFSDPKSEWRFFGRLGTVNLIQGSNSIVQNFNSKNDLINENAINTASQIRTNDFFIQTSNFRKFRKPGNTLIIGIALNKVTAGGDEHLNNNSRYLMNGSFYKDSLRQMTKVSNDRIELISSVNLTYQLKKAVSFEWNNSGGLLLADASRKAYSIKQSTAPEYLDSFSTDVDYKAILVKSSFSLVYQSKKLSLTTRLGFNVNNLHQRNRLLSNVFQFNQFGFSPAVFGTTKTKYGNIQFELSSAPILPILNQMIPVVNNFDPYNIRIGNANLKQSFENKFSVNWNLSQVLKSTYFNLGLRVVIPTNDFSTAEIINERGQRTVQFINVNGNRRIYPSFNMGFPIWGNKISASTRILSSINSTRNFINEVLNTTNYGSLGSYNELYLKLSEKYTMTFSCNFIYNKVRSSINKFIDNNYWSNTVAGFVEIGLSKKSKLTINYDGMFLQAGGFYSKPTQVNTLNASISLIAFKNNRGKFVLEGNDLLNQTKYFNRSTIDAVSIETRNRRMGRVVLLQFEWSFDKLGGKSEN